ncbi:hypothetical protein AA958_08980 [Streptomyces sp. CNQ-509]|uniref:DUF397 domain-containing protein n=1 Tax=unclassified Streptomyces TaxID=2593676 RepID=UPI00062DE4C7|nr:DUF397 domain-containing protein [Streptomyces sp. CNQ-509]AKH82340.1 hypothetical protein AA958_08980 [Streptomyces sp. CNQ-509]
MNHMNDASTLAVAWWKSSHSGAQADCVEVGIVDERAVAVRDSKDPAGPALLLTRDQFAGLVDSVRAGRFEV